MLGEPQSIFIHDERKGAAVERKCDEGGMMVPVQLAGVQWMGADGPRAEAERVRVGTVRCSLLALDRWCLLTLHRDTSYCLDLS